MTHILLPEACCLCFTRSVNPPTDSSPAGIICNSDFVHRTTVTPTSREGHFHPAGSTAAEGAANAICTLCALIVRRRARRARTRHGPPAARVAITRRKLACATPTCGGAVPTGSGLRATSFHSFLFIISALPPCNSSVSALVVERHGSIWPRDRIQRDFISESAARAGREGPPRD